MIFVKDKGRIGAALSDNTILGLVNTDVSPENAIDNFVDEQGVLSETYFEVKRYEFK